MLLTTNWEKPIFEEEIILQIQPTDLDDSYVAASDFDKSNLFFVLLTSYHHYLDSGKRELAAHLCFLMAYYLFITLTPPGSMELALHYIKEAISLNPLETYKEWLFFIEKGN